MTDRLRRVGAVLIMAAFLATAAVPAYADAAVSVPNYGHSLTIEATAEGADLTVRSATQATADHTLLLAENAWRELAPRFLSLPRERIVIVVVEDADEYERIQPAPMTRGFATFGGNRIYLRGPDLDQEVVTHELAHILLGKNVRPGLAIPDWFNEGFAQYVSRSSGHRLEVFYSVASGRLLSIPELDRVDALAGPDRELATIEGLAVVEFLVARYGETALWDLVSRLSHARTFSQALHDTYGRTDLELSDEWLAYASEEYGIFSLVGLETVATTAFGMLALIALAVWATTRIRLRKNPLSPLDLTEREILEAERAAAFLDAAGGAGERAGPDDDTEHHTPAG